MTPPDTNVSHISPMSHCSYRHWLAGMIYSRWVVGDETGGFMKPEDAIWIADKLIHALQRDEDNV